MSLTRVLSRREISTVFQPIVDLDSDSIVAFEALSRGPAGPLQQPDALFAAARSEGSLAELDALCQVTALHAAVSAGIRTPLAVFVNVEPEVIDSAPLEELIEIARVAPGGLPVVLEITERAIGARPAELLSSVRRLRAAGWRIALDDVGADDMSLAFMPLLRPDIVKLDLSLVQQRPTPAVAGIMNAVNAYAERSGALVLAEGIENEHHLQIAKALGARLGQGFLFGRPAPTLATDRPAGELGLARPSTHQRHEDVPPSPFGCLPAGYALRRSTKPLLLQLTRHLEEEAMRQGSICIIAATFQVSDNFSADIAARYNLIAQHVAFVAAVGGGLRVIPEAGIHQTDVDDPALADEWDVVVLTPHFAAALLARDLGDTGPEDERRFDFALTYNRETVAAAAESLLARVATAGASATAGATGRRAGSSTR